MTLREGQGLDCLWAWKLELALSTSPVSLGSKGVRLTSRRQAVNETVRAVISHVEGDLEARLGQEEYK
jgi:hypothetical protein